LKPRFVAQRSYIRSSISVSPRRCAGAGLQRHDRVAQVVLAVEQRRFPQARHLRAQRRGDAAISSSISPPSIAVQLLGVLIVAL
jgi:hypothetical protein